MITRVQASEATIDQAARRVMDRCDELAGVSAEQGKIARVHLSPEHARVNRQVARWMQEVGMRTWQDAAGNLIGRLEVADAAPSVLLTEGPGRDSAAALLLGSHLDTVIDAGRYDGVVGVMMAIEVVRLLAVAADDHSYRSPYPFALEVIAFADEEGARFGTALLGSSAVAGRWSPDWWSLTDAEGTTLREAFLDFGLDPSRIDEAARDPDRVVGYLEAHIEQGPELDRRGEPLAVVSSIASARRFQLVVTGEARHAGGTPYDMRHDALLGASEVALAVEEICRAEHHVIGTVGQFEAHPGAVNVIPGEVRFSLDLRGELDDHRDQVWARISEQLDRVSGRRGLSWRAEEIHNAPAVVCAPFLRDVIGSSVQQIVPSSEDPAQLFSRAGHDAMALGGLTDVGMLFLRNPDGISHHPDEGVSTADVALGLRTLAESVAHVAAEYR